MKKSPSFVQRLPRRFKQIKKNLNYGKNKNNSTSKWSRFIVYNKFKLRFHEADPAPRVPPAETRLTVHR